MGKEITSSTVVINEAQRDVERDERRRLRQDGNIKVREGYFRVLLDIEANFARSHGMTRGVNHRSADGFVVDGEVEGIVDGLDTDGVARAGRGMERGGGAAGEQVPLAIKTPEGIVAAAPGDDLEDVVARLIGSRAEDDAVIVGAVVRAMHLGHGDGETKIAVLMSGIEGQRDILRGPVLDVILLAREEKGAAGRPVVAIGEVIGQRLADAGRTGRLYIGASVSQA